MRGKGTSTSFETPHAPRTDTIRRFISPGQSKRNRRLSLAGFLWLLTSACLLGQSTIQFSPRYGPSALEDAGSIRVSVTRVDALETVVTVDYATSDVTATAGQDYLGASGILTFAVGETNQTFSVPILNDALTEGNEAFEVTLSNPGAGAVLGPRITVRVHKARAGRPIGGQALGSGSVDFAR